MQHIENRSAIRSGEHSNQLNREFRQTNIVARYVGSTMFKVLKAVHNNIYTANRPEDSNIKRGSKYIARTFFNAVEAVNAKCYFTLGASALAISAGIATNYIGTKDETNHKYGSSLIYYGGASLIPIISCSIINFINTLHKYFEDKLEYIHTSNNYIPVILTSRQRENPLVELYNSVIPVTSELINEAVRSNRLQEQPIILLTAIIIEISHNNELIIAQLLDWLRGENLGETNSANIERRESEIIAYDELKLYDGDAIDAKTFCALSGIAFKDLKEPVFCQRQVYGYEYLAKWHMEIFSNKNAICPHNHNKLIWSNVQRIEKPELIAMD